MVFKQNQRLDHMRVFNEKIYAHTNKEKSEKLDDSNVTCYYLGYNNNTKANRLYTADDGSIVISRSVSFAEHPFVKDPKKLHHQVIDIISDKEVEAPASDGKEAEAPAEDALLRTPPLRVP